MGADICPDGSNLIATVGYDCTVKWWLLRPLIKHANQGQIKLTRFSEHSH